MKSALFLSSFNEWHYKLSFYLKNNMNKQKFYAFEVVMFVCLKIIKLTEPPVVKNAYLHILSRSKILTVGVHLRIQKHIEGSVFIIETKIEKVSSRGHWNFCFMTCTCKFKMFV